MIGCVGGGGRDPSVAWRSATRGRNGARARARAHARAEQTCDGDCADPEREHREAGRPRACRVLSARRVRKVLTKPSTVRDVRAMKCDVRRRDASAYSDASIVSQYLARDGG